ncbi:hypothetical protein ACCO45_007335 [Purpureocillium lilacinum]|uniref:Uncharacterized protein n=1 Tax=Purpureocillium lilacinum TaxID=33203 RepID=A0ACC4DSU0_PURLI
MPKSLGRFAYLSVNTGLSMPIDVDNNCKCQNHCAGDLSTQTRRAPSLPNGLRSSEIPQKAPLYDHEKPFQYLIPIPPDSKDQRTTNVEFETRGRLLQISDIDSAISTSTATALRCETQLCPKKQRPDEDERPIWMATACRPRPHRVWRPLDHPVEDFPLAFCDASTLAEQDIVECDHVRRDYRGATLYPHFNPGQKFYYVGGQTPDEVVLFKIFDSDPDVRAKSEMCALLLWSPFANANLEAAEEY